jgi:hypothetical protein
MKVLTAQVLSWLLSKVGTKLLFWSADLEDWAGVGDYYANPDEYKAGGTSSDD